MAEPSRTEAPRDPIVEHLTWINGRPGGPWWWICVADGCTARDAHQTADGAIRAASKHERERR